MRSALEVYFPELTHIDAVKGDTSVPLFPGYLFLRWNNGEPGLPSLRAFPHVLGWVNFCGVIPAVPDSVVSQLAQWLQDVNSKGGDWRRFEPGQAVRVVAGHVNWLAEVLEGPKSPRARAKVLLSFIGRKVAAEVPWESLQSIEVIAKEQTLPPRRTRGKGRWIRGFSSPGLGPA